MDPVLLTQYLDIFQFPAALTENCVRFLMVAIGTYPVAMAGTTLLFFFRVRAFFNRDKFVVAFLRLHGSQFWLEV